MRTFGRYLVFQLPGILLVALVLAALTQWTEISVALAAGLLALWIGKDLALFPFVRRAYETGPGRHVGTDPLIGQRAEVVEPLEPQGYVRVRGELWHAELQDPEETQRLGPGSVVRIEGVRGLTLLVRGER